MSWLKNSYLLTARPYSHACATGDRLHPQVLESTADVRIYVRLDGVDLDGARLIARLLGGSAVDRQFF